MKKLLALITAASLCLTMAGCGGEKNSSKENETTTLTWYVPLSPQEDLPLVMEAAAKITEPLIGAKIDLQCIEASSFTERMNMNMASGSNFDITFSGWVNPYLTAVKRGGLMDITELIDEHTTELKGSIPDYAWEAAKVDGKIYAVPNLQIFAPPTSMLMIKEITEKYGLDVENLNHVSELEGFLQKVKENEPLLYPYRPHYGVRPWTDGIYELIQSDVAIRTDGSSPEVFFLYDTPEYQEGLKTLHEWYKKGYIRSDILSMGSDAADLKLGKYVVNQSGWAPGAEVSAKINNGGKDMVLKPIMKPYLTKDKALATMNAIGKSSKNAEKAIKMIELINTNKELYNLISYGIEGTHYKKDAEGKVEVDTQSGYVTNSAWMFGNQFNAYLQVGQDDDVWEQTSKLNDEAIKSPLLGFVLDTDPIKNEISQISAINSEYALNTFIVNGLDNWDEYMKKLETAGSKKVLAEIQKQVNEYWKTK